MPTYLFWGIILLAQFDNMLTTFLGFLSRSSRPRPKDETWTLPEVRFARSLLMRYQHTDIIRSPRQMYRVKASGRVFMIPIDVFITQPG